MAPADGALESSVSPLFALHPSQLHLTTVSIRFGEDVLRLGPLLDIILTLLILTPRQDEDVLCVQRGDQVVPVGDNLETLVHGLFGSGVHVGLNTIEGSSDGAGDIVKRDGPLLVVVPTDSEGRLCLDISWTEF